MASCAKCGANLISQARFCASCGSPVASGSIAPAPPAAQPPGKSVPDPFARTILSDGLGPAPDAPPPAVSPMAASVMASQSQPPPGRGSAIPAPQPPRPAGAPLPTPSPAAALAALPIPAPAAQAQGYSGPPGPTQYAAPLPQQSHPFAQGSLVMVYWADGNRYPGTVLQVAQHHVMVAFPNGVQQWIDARYVQAGR
ncbi:MAG TPA: hypothetical protein VIF09_23890 [Polyangiaceae bacterium]